MDLYRTRLSVALVFILSALIYVMPNIVNFGDSWWFSKAKLNYGLDIQGGLHLVMGVDVDTVVAEHTARLVNSLKGEFAKETISADVFASKATEGEIQLKKTDAPLDKASKYILDKYATTLREIDSSADVVTFRYLDNYLNDYKSKVIQQSIETIRNRIDEFGVAEPSIQQQGANRILIQLPGMADAERAKELINTTARLDFMIVSDGMPQDQITKLIQDAEKAGNYSLATTKYSEYVTKLNKDLEGKIPAKTVVYFEKNANAQKMENGAVPILLKTDTDLGGGALDDAFVNFGQYGEPEVSLRFNAGGAQKFADLTGANIQKRMAIVLDKVVKSAPNIQTKITGGNAVITLGGSRNRDAGMNEAKMISTALRAGALPAALEQLEERRVGPTLGADSINSAKIASYVGAVLVILLIIFLYKAMGVIATVCLAINILSVFALLTSLGATITLPGIAGIALTVGFAVDANVLINERIREELKHTGSFQVAIREGYERAMSAILDSNITTAATAIVLLYFGTGPVKGFAVTLLIGIVTTLFANVFVSKVLVDTLVYKFGFKKLSV